MQFKPPKDSDKYQWTNHVKGKMMYYGISESLIKRIVRFPKRKEDGIAPATVGVMQPTSNKKKPQEIWVMYQVLESRTWNIEFRNKINRDPKSKIISPIPDSKFQIPAIRVISAWRYPGISPIGKKIPIPDEILMELENLIG